MKLKPLSYIPLLVLAIIFIYPFWWMIVNSLNTAADILNIPSLLPRSWQWNNYIEIFKVQPFALQYINTLFISILGTAGNIMISTLAGYGFARLKFPGRNTAFIFLLTALMMPIEVTIIPLFFQMKALRLLDTFVPLILIPIFASQGAFSTFLMRQYFITLPKELEEAARVDGLNTFSIFTRIMLPNAGPVTASAAILAFLSIWNTYLEPLVFINTLKKFTLSLALANFNDSYGLPQWHLQLAATTLSIIPILTVYFIFQKRISNAMVNSGMKG